MSRGKYSVADFYVVLIVNLLDVTGGSEGDAKFALQIQNNLLLPTRIPFSGIT